MSTLMIIVEKEPNVTEPLFSFVGCGVLKVILSETCETNEIKEILNGYIEKNIIKISDTIKKDTKEYRKRWTEKVERICEEYGLDKQLPSFTTKLKIAKTNKVIYVTSDIYGILTEIRFTFDPVSSILDEDTFDTLLRYGILREGIALINRVKDGIEVAVRHSNGEKEVDRMISDKETYEYKKKELSQEYETVSNRISSEKFSIMYGRLKSSNILERTI